MLRVHRIAYLMFIGAVLLMASDAMSIPHTFGYYPPMHETLLGGCAMPMQGAPLNAVSTNTDTTKIALISSVVGLGGMCVYLGMRYCKAKAALAQQEAGHCAAMKTQHAAQQAEHSGILSVLTNDLRDAANRVAVQELRISVLEADIETYKAFFIERSVAAPASQTLSVMVDGEAQTEDYLSDSGLLHFIRSYASSWLTSDNQDQSA